MADERAGVGRIIFEPDDAGEAVVVSLLGGVGLDVIVGDGVGGVVARVLASERAGVGRIIFEPDDAGEAVVVSLLGGAGLDVFVGDGVGGVVARVLASEVIVIRTDVSSEYPD